MLPKLFRKLFDLEFLSHIIYIGNGSFKHIYINYAKGVLSIHEIKST